MNWGLSAEMPALGGPPVSTCLSLPPHVSSPSFALLTWLCPLSTSLSTSHCSVLTPVPTWPCAPLPSRGTHLPGPESSRGRAEQAGVPGASVSSALQRGWSFPLLLSLRSSLRAEGKAKEHTLAGKQSKGWRRPGPAFAIGSWFGWPGAGLRGF